MQFVLAVRPADGVLQEVLLPETGVVRIGREAPADIVCADGFLSRFHAEIDCQAGVFTVRDAGSRNGILVNGVRVRESALCHGDTLLAGRSALRLTAKVNGRQGAGLLSTSPKLAGWQDTVVAKLRDSSGFALVDGARNMDVLPVLKGGGGWFQSLYEGEAAVGLAPQGPYLVELGSVASLLPLLVERGWGKAWGVYLAAEVSFEELRRHLRRYLTVVDEAGQSLLFRFYDPRVMETFLRTCTPEERKAFFGPVERFAMETMVQGELLVITPIGEERISCKA